MNQQTLPQTNDNNQEQMAAFGTLGLLASMFGLFGISKKRK